LACFSSLKNHHAKHHNSPQTHHDLPRKNHTKNTPFLKTPFKNARKTTKNRLSPGLNFLPKKI